MLSDENNIIKKYTKMNSDPDSIIFTINDFQYKTTYRNNILQIESIHCQEFFKWKTIISDPVIIPEIINKNNSSSKLQISSLFKLFQYKPTNKKLEISLLWKLFQDISSKKSLDSTYRFIFPEQINDPHTEISIDIKEFFPLENNKYAGSIILKSEPIDETDRLTKKNIMMQDYIKTYLEQPGLIVQPINDNDLKVIYDLYHDGIKHEKLSVVALDYYGLYFQKKKKYDDMLQYFLTAIDQKNITSMHHLAEYYSGKKNYDKITEYYLMAIKHNDAISMHRLASHYGEQNNYDKMVEYYLMAIKHNNSESMQCLAYHYGLQKNYTEMIKYYLMAIDHDDTISMNNLAHYYKTQQNYNKMIKYYLMAIKHGCAIAMYNMGYYFSEEKNYTEMIKYHEMASEHGNTDAMNELGHYYMEQYRTTMLVSRPVNGQAHLINVKQTENYNKMMKYYNMAIKQGNSLAMSNMAYYYESIGDFQNMIKYYLMAIKHKNSMAMYNLGVHYANHRDTNSMLKYYLMAIDNGNVFAMMAMANWCKKKKNNTDTTTYYLMAINVGHTEAMVELGKYYEEQNDYTNMMKYYNMAIILGNDDSEYNVERYMETFLEKYYKQYRINGDKNDIKILFDLCHDNKICHNLSSNALYYYGWYYQLNGKFDEMKKYYQLAIDMDNDLAKRKLTTYMEDTIIKYLRCNNQTYDDHIYHMSDMIAIYDLFTEDNPGNYYYSMMPATVLYYFGVYYQIKQNYTEMVKCYLSAAVTNHILSKNRFKKYTIGFVQKYLEKHKFACEKEITMYEDAVIIYDLYLNNIVHDTVSNLVLYYYIIYYHLNKKYNEMNKYCLLLSDQYENNRQYDELFSSISMRKIIIQVFKNQNQNIQEISQLQLTVDKLEKQITHLKFMPGGIGYEEAKKEFENIRDTK